MRVFFFPVLWCAFLAFILFPSCKHDPVFNVEPDPTDTTGNGGGGGTGGGNSGVLCDPDSVYFSNQILPILISNCTQSTCHNELDHEEGIVLTSYQNMLATVNHVTTFNWDENELLKVLIEDDPDKRMPYGKPPLPQAQIDLIATWVQQGAKNNACNENAGQCDTANISYNNFIQQLVQTRCQGCHSGTNPQGAINLENYQNVKTVAGNGLLYTVVTRTSNWMPKGGQKMDDCTTSKIKAWIDRGMPNN